MGIVLSALSLILWLYLLVLLARVVIDLVQIFSRTWRPTGIVLVLANVVYGLTDPPLRFIRRFVPPVRIGQISLDLGFIILFLGVQLVRGFLLPVLAAALL
ncbi:YggT family protein [Georgenia sp. Z1491]|uniref:YggT family protein n=1 Tax=Georgenia sp. Z1491 TaxID=3416707 RepID=UPI003CEDD93E